MDSSYPVTPYPMSAYGVSVESQQTPGRPQQMYLITPPTPTPSSPPSQAATLVREPIMIRPEDGYMFANGMSAMHPLPQGIIPQQSINTAQSPQQLKPLQYSAQGSYEPMPGMFAPPPATSNGGGSGGEHHGASSPPPAFLRPSRLRPASDMPVYTSYYTQAVRHHQSPPPEQAPPSSNCCTGKQDSLCKPAAQQQPTTDNRILRVHSNLGKVLLPYWMLLSLALLISMTALTGRLLATQSSLDRTLYVVRSPTEGGADAPVVPVVQNAPTTAPALEDKPASLPLARPRALHSAPIPLHHP